MFVFKFIFITITVSYKCINLNNSFLHSSPACWYENSLFSIWNSYNCKGGSYRCYSRINIIIARIPYWLPPCFNDWKHAQTRHIWLRRDKLVEKEGEILLASSPVNSFSSCFAFSSSSPAVHKLGGARGYVKYLRPWKDTSNDLKDSSSSSSEKHEEEEYSISHTKQTSTEI